MPPLRQQHNPSSLLAVRLSDANLPLLSIFHGYMHSPRCTNTPASYSLKEYTDSGDALILWFLGCYTTPGISPAAYPQPPLEGSQNLPISPMSFQRQLWKCMKAPGKLGWKERKEKKIIYLLIYLRLKPWTMQDRQQLAEQELVEYENGEYQVLPSVFPCHEVIWNTLIMEKQCTEHNCQCPSLSGEVLVEHELENCTKLSKNHTTVNKKWQKLSTATWNAKRDTSARCVSGRASKRQRQCRRVMHVQRQHSLCPWRALGTALMCVMPQISPCLCSFQWGITLSLSKTQYSKSRPFSKDSAIA